MIVNKYQIGGGSASGGTGSQGPQGPQGYQGAAGAGGDPSEVQDMIDASLLAFGAELEEGDPIVGMAAQLYSPDGVSVDGYFNYRTTAGDVNITSTLAELRKVGGNSTYPHVMYNDSASLKREGESVTGFTYDIEWGDFTEWIETTREGDVSSYHSKVFKVTNIENTDGYVHFITTDGLDIGIRYNGDYWQTNQNCSQIDDTHFSFDGGIIECSLSATIATITAGTAYWAEARTDYFNAGGYYVFIGIEIPNDIVYGTNNYTYGESAWTPSLPQALRNMEVDGSDYVPQSGDEITIVRQIAKSGSTVFSTPTGFVALSMNSFNKDEDTLISKYTEDNGVYSVSIYAVHGLENGYVVYDENSGITAVGISDSATGTMDTTGVIMGEVVSVVFPTSEKPYILVTTTDIDGLCIHPRWTGIKDEEYAEYAESKVNLPELSDMWSVGDTRNYLDLENGKFHKSVYRVEYSTSVIDSLFNDGKTLGTDFDFDEDYIYIVGADSATDFTVINYKYNASDFAVEYFVDANGIITSKVFADTFYMNNLVDKLRNLTADFIHLDKVIDGKEGVTYEYEGRLMKWVEGEGYVAEWLKPISQAQSREGNGLIYSIIPDGQILFEYKYTYGGDWRYLIYSGETLYCTETGGTVVSTIQKGNTIELQAQGSSYNKIYVNFENGHIGFRKDGSISTQNEWGGSASGSHYELINKYNYPYTSSDNGIPEWNEKGQIVKQNRSVGSKNIYINTNGTSYSNRTTVLTDGTGNGPDRWFAPTQGGTEGQMLISAGENGAPTWSNWIKSVQITSDAYDALVQAGTTDANTLYLIVDE